MSRLSIIIPALRSGELLENTLLSVLENRPESCQIVLACDQYYEDPYQLGDEVDFAIVDQANNWMHAANVGLQHSSNRYVHLMLPGVRASSDWCDAALEMLDNADASTAALIPRIVFDSATADCCGLGFTPGGRLVEVSNRQLAKRDVVIHSAYPGTGFYRQDALLRIGGWEESIHPEIANLEMMLRFYALGKSAVFSDACSVFANSAKQLVATRNGNANHYMLARDIERLYLECGAMGCARSSAHIGTVLQGVARSIPTGTMFSEVAGRLVGRFGAKRNAAPDQSRKAA